MNERIDLRQLERKAYLSYHQDGLVDIVIGLAIITFGIMFLPWFIETSWMAFSGLFIVWVITFAGIKRAITVPRIGYVEFKARRRTRLMLLIGVLTVINVVLFLIPALGLLTPELRQFLTIYGYALVALVVGGLFILFGFVTEIQRLMGYGIIAFVVFLIAQFFPMHLSIPVIVVGLMMAVYGFVLLFRFLRKYPKVETENELDDPWEAETDNGGGNVQP